MSGKIQKLLRFLWKQIWSSARAAAAFNHLALFPGSRLALILLSVTEQLFTSRFFGESLYNFDII